MPTRINSASMQLKVINYQYVCNQNDF